MLGKQYGVSLIELMLAIVIVGLLTVFGIPSYSNWIQNQQIRTAAESIMNGIQLTRSEAVKNNGRARLVLCGLPASSWEIRATQAGAVADATVSPACQTTVPAGEVRVQERSSQEGSTRVQVTVTPNGASTLTFNGLGRVVSPNADGSAAITQIDLSIPTGRALRITVGASGNARMCDPSALLAATDPRHC